MGEPSHEARIESAWQQYRAMLACPGVTLWGRPLCVTGGETPDGRDETFWHMVTGGRGGRGDRQLVPARLELVGRVWDLLERLATGENDVTWWLELGRDGSRSILVAPADLSMVVVLRERPTRLRLVTAFPSSWRHLAPKLQEAKEQGRLRPALRVYRPQEPNRRTRPLSGRARRWWEASLA